MTENPSEKTVEAANNAVAETDEFTKKIVSIIDDPFKSAIGATIATATAFGTVLSGIWLVQVAIS